MEKGKAVKKVSLYIHCMSGNAAEANFYRPLLDGEVVGLDYDNYDPRIAKELILQKYIGLLDKYDEKGIVVNRIGAYFAMLALSDRKVCRTI